MDLKAGGEQDASNAEEGTAKVEGDENEGKQNAPNAEQNASSKGEAEAAQEKAARED